MQQAEELGERLQAIIDRPPREIKRALAMPGMSQALTAIASCPGRRKIGMVVAAFVLGTYIGNQQAQLEALWPSRNSQVRKEKNEPISQAAQEEVDN